MCELGKPEERAAIAETLRGHILQLALDMYGCRVLQKVIISKPCSRSMIFSSLFKMIEYLSAEEQAEWVIELHGHVLQCVKDANGNHVSLLNFNLENYLADILSRSFKSSWSSLSRNIQRL